MRKQDKKILDDIIEQMWYGNWGYAKERYIELNCTPQEFTEYLDNLSGPNAVQIMRDIALLGFYTRKDKE